MSKQNCCPWPPVSCHTNHRISPVSAAETDSDSESYIRWNLLQMVTEAYLQFVRMGTQFT